MRTLDNPLIPRLAALIPLLGMLVMPAAAQQTEIPAIATDRPGQSTSPSVLIPGHVQIEAGAQMATTASGDDAEASGTTTWSIPSALVRIGLLPAMELRLGGEYRSIRTRQEQSAIESTTTGIASLSAGAKIGITPEEGAMPETALLLTFALPYGADEFRPAAVAPTFLLAMRSSLGGPLSLYYNLGGSWDGSNGAGTGLYTISLSASFTSRVSGFAELYGSLASGVPPVHAADAGLACVLAPNVQIDLHAGAGITPNAPDYFINAGVAFRLPR